MDRDLDIEVKKFYVRFREGVPETEMHYAMYEGCRLLGVKTEPFTWVDDVPEKMHDLSPEVGVAGYIGDVWAGLDRLGKPHPAPVDYPVELINFLGREVRQTILGTIRNSVKPTFVKPVEHKVFAGFVHRCDGESRMRLVSCGNDVPVWVSDVIDFRSEHRVFVLRGEILDVRRYKGDWSIAPDFYTVERAVAAWKSAPAACCLDFGITQDGGSTLLVEANDGFAFGTYGLATKSYARMLSARWNELALQGTL